MTPLLFAASLLAAQYSVVELFTSEGCSSCPPADRALSRLAQDDRVVALGWHVDYWDRLGWRDPLASPAATARQYGYGRALARDGVYTPQLVVNGARDCVGSDPDCVAAALRTTTVARVALAVDARADGALDVRISGGPTTRGLVALVALVEDGVVIDVPRGENAGRRLRHDRAVRTHVVADVVDGAARATLTPPARALGKRRGVVAIVQDARTLRVVAAARHALP